MLVERVDGVQRLKILGTCPVGHQLGSMDLRPLHDQADRAWWQATLRFPAPLPSGHGARAGTSRPHRSSAWGHRGWNAQPEGGSSRLGSSKLLRGSSRLDLAFLGSGEGMALRRARR